MHSALRHAPIGILQTTPEGTVTAVNANAAELLDIEDGTAIQSSFPKSASGTLRDAFEDGPPEAMGFEEYYPAIERWLAVDLEPTDDGVVVYVRDRSAHHETRRTIDRLGRRLDRIEAIDALVADVLETVIDATDRMEVARTLCSRLGGDDGYAFAWVGERDPHNIMAAAGDDASGMQAAISEAEATIPEQRAADTGQPQTVERIADDETVPRSVRVAAFGSGLQSAVAIPLTYRDTVYGVLGVYTAREDGLSEQERSSLATLGAVAGFAINAIRQEGLLFADTVTELTLDVQGSATPFGRAADGDRTISLSGVVPREDGSAVCYVRVDGATDGVTDALADTATVSAVRAVREPGHLEVELTPETPLATIAAWGGTVETAVFDGKRGRITVVVSADSDPRRLVETVRETVRTVDVAAKTERSRNPETVQQFRTEFDERLTDRQRQVLRTAYLADYFTSPRGSSAEEVADALGVTGPTVLHHLRNAQRSLLSSFFTDLADQ